MSVKLRETKVKIITDPAAATFEANVNAYLQSQKEGELVSVQYRMTDTQFTALIVYSQ